MNAQKLLAVKAITLFIAVATSAASLSQELPKCGAARVNYKAFDESYASKILVNPPTDSHPLPPSGEKAYSPQRTRWLIKESADYMKPSPWTTRFYFGSGDGRPDLELKIVDHGNSLDINWINDKLIFGQIWWGRIYSTDFVFDVEQHRFIYKEMAHYGDLIEPCE